jgi:Tfp pilus assembly protein PilO
MSVGTDRKVVFALLGIAALCLIGLGLSVYRAKADDLNRLQRQLTEKRDQLSEVQSKLASQSELEEKYKRLQDRLSVLEPTLPDSAYIPTFLHQIENLATSTNNRIVLIRPKPKPPAGQGRGPVINNETGEIIEGAPESGEEGRRKAGEEEPIKLPYDYVGIELRVEGTYWTLIDFLAELQRFPKMIAVNDVGFEPDRAMTGPQRSPKLAASMDLTAVVTKGAKDDT